MLTVCVQAGLYVKSSHIFLHGLPDYNIFINNACVYRIAQVYLKYVCTYLCIYTCVYVTPVLDGNLMFEIYCKYVRTQCLDNSDVDQTFM